MSRVFVNGLGAVSPAGWGVPALRQALQKAVPVPTGELARPGWAKPLMTRPVPAPSARPAFLAHARLRRTSPISHYISAAALEALGPERDNDRLGIILCLQSGCVQYSNRFFGEVINSPATASPLVFPETVLAAPASHLAALIQPIEIAHTLTGDPATFLTGLALAADWLLEERVDRCLVVGAEEPDWLLADALWAFDHKAILATGAGAICLSRYPTPEVGIELERITDAFTYTSQCTRSVAAKKMRAQLPFGNTTELLCEGTQDHPRIDTPETAAWRDWNGPRLRPKTILGEGLTAAAAWQCVAACDALTAGPLTASVVSLVGCNQQAIGARFIRSA